MTRSLLLFLLTGVLTAGCATALAPDLSPAPADPAAEMRADLITVDPARAVPGAVVGVRFPTEMTRGVHFVLEREVVGGWAYRYDLTSDGPGPGWQRTWSPAGAEGFGVEDIGVGGPGPDRVVIPEVAEPGTWRICTGNAAENVCAPIEVVDP